MKALRPDIFTYHNHVDLLKGWVEYLRATQSEFSLRLLARKAGLASGYLPMVLNGTRALSSAALTKLIPHLGLNANEQSFLECLLILGTSESHEARMVALERMQRFSQFRQNQFQQTATYDYLTHWHYVAIRELATVPDFQAEAKWVQEQLRFPVPLREVKEALEFLLKNKFLEKKSDGSIIPPSDIMYCDGEIYRVSLAHFHREIMRLAAESITSIPREERFIMGHTCALDQEDYQKAREIVEEAIQKIRKLGDAKPTAEGAVFHLELALFPLTHQGGKKDE